MTARSRHLLMAVSRILYYDNHNHLHAGWFIKQIPSVKNHLITNRGKTIRFIIKPGMRWSNGQEITAPDYIFGWKVEMNPATSACLGTCDAIATMTAIGKCSFVYHMNHVYSVLPTLAIWRCPTPGAVSATATWPRPRSSSGRPRASITPIARP